MTTRHLVRLLRNTPVREIISALERDGFSYRRTTGSSRVYRHVDGRRAVIHYHRGSDVVSMYILRNLIQGTGWIREDLERLGLVGRSRDQESDEPETC
jgi:predicted RNA binding protein YcfA (HicA-like mRNA interferase family)